MPLDSIEQNCTDVSNSDISVYVNGGIIPYQIGDTAPVNIGSNRIIYTATNACLSRLVPDTIDQNVMAPDRPMLVCDSTLNRAISMNFQDSIKVLMDSAFASADVTSCIPHRLLARKIDPICGTTADTFMTYLEFCAEETVSKFLIELIAQDSMGRRSDTCEVWLDIQEKAPPTLSILENPVVELDTSGTFTLDSSIIIASFGDNSGCISSISVTGSGLGMMTGSLSFLNSGVWTTFTCQDTGQYFVKVTVTDCSNNMAMDTTILTVNSGGNCNGTTAPAYTGVVTAYGVEPMEGAIFSVSSDNIELISITDINGYFDFEIPVNGDYYRMAGLYPDEWRAGISAHDLALMEEYIIGLRDLNVYQELSADVDNNGRISLADVLIARKILLGIQEEIDELEPWIFRNAISEGLESLESIDSYALRKGGLDIQAVKRGDLDADAMGVSIVRSVDEIVIEELDSEKGVNTRFRIHLGDPSALMAAQASINIINSEGWYVVDHHMDIHTSIADNRLDFLYYQHTDPSALWIDIEVTQSEDVDFSIGHYMQALTWDYNKGARSIALTRVKKESSAALSQSKIQLSAYPNPTELLTTITMEWSLIKAGESVDILLADALGRAIYASKIQLDSKTGYTAIPIELPYDPGLYILSAQTSEWRQQLKIVKN